jgi:DNA-binding transcriptional LysR family regulator
MAMELTDFALFLEVAQQGSFSRAAGVLRLAQPSVSTRIAALAAVPLEVTCRTAHSHEVAEQLADGAAHAGFLLGTAVPGGIIASPLYKVPVIAIAHRDHPAASRPPRLSDLAAHRLAIHSWGPGVSELGEILRTIHIPPTRVCWVSPAATALVLAAEHGHIAILPADAARPGLCTGVVAQVKIMNLPKWSMNVAVAYRRGFAEQSPEVLQILTETATKMTEATR